MPEPAALHNTHTYALGPTARGSNAEQQAMRKIWEAEYNLLLGLLDQAVALAGAKQTVVGAGHTDLVVAVLVLHRIGDLHSLVLAAGEDNQLAVVLLQPLSVQLQRLHAAVPAAVVHRDTNAASLLLVDASRLQLSKREATALAELVVVLDGGRAHNGPQQAGRRAGRHLGSLLLASGAPALLAGRLLKPGLHMVLPSHLVEVSVGDLPVDVATHLEGSSHHSPGEGCQDGAPPS